MRANGVDRGGHIRAMARMCNGMASFVRGKKSWLPLFALALIWSLGFIRIFVDPTPRIPLLFNWTGSLPYHVAWLHRGVATLNRGDFVVYSFSGAATAQYPGLAHQPFFKVVAGMPGDRVRVHERDVFVGEKYVGFAKSRTFDGRPLTPLLASVVPAGHYYVMGTDADSFDSRYAESGFVSATDVIGKVTPWF